MAVRLCPWHWFSARAGASLPRECAVPLVVRRRKRNHAFSEFRTDHADALDDLFTQVLVTLVDKDLVRVSRISQDGVRVSAGSGSFCREERLQQLLEQARQQVLELRKQLESPGQSAVLTARKKAALNERRSRGSSDWSRRWRNYRS